MIELESLHIADTDSGKDNQCSLKLLGTKFIENNMFQKERKKTTCSKVPLSELSTIWIEIHFSELFQFLHYHVN